MIFPNGFKQARLASVLEYGCMHIRQVYFDAIPIQFLHQAFDGVRAGHIELLLSTEVEDHRPGKGFPFSNHGFNTIPEGGGVGIVQLRIQPHD